SDDLNPRIVALPNLGPPEPGCVRLQLHLFARFLEGKEHADRRLVSVHYTLEIPHHARIHVPTFHADKHGCKVAAFVSEGDHTVDSPIRTLLLNATHRLRIYKAKRPPLELVAALSALCELARSLYLGGLTNHRHILNRESVLKTSPHDSDG